MSFSMVKNMMKIAKMLMIFKALQERSSETNVLMDDDQNEIVHSANYPPFNSLKLEVEGRGS